MVYVWVLSVEYHGQRTAALSVQLVPAEPVRHTAARDEKEEFDGGSPDAGFGDLGDAEAQATAHGAGPGTESAE